MPVNYDKVRICQKCSVRFKGHRSRVGNWCPSCVEKAESMTYRDCHDRKDYRCTGRFFQTRDEQSACLFCLGLQNENLDELLFTRMTHYDLWKVEKV